MASKWIALGNGLKYREHDTRKHAGKPDRYYAVFHWVNGKTVCEAFGWASYGIKQKDCEAVLAELKQNRKLGKYPGTVAEYREHNRRQTQETQEQESYERSLTLQGIFEGGYMAAQTAKGEKALRTEKLLMKNHVIPFFKNTPLRDITPSRMDSFLAYLTKKQSNRTGKTLSAASIRYSLAVVRQIWNYALSRDLTDAPYPAKRVKAPSADNRRTRFLTRDEAELLLAALLERSQDTHDMASLSLFCGLRAGELFKLTWNDVNFHEGFIHIRDRKNKESGTAWMTPRVREMLEGRTKSNDLVFPALDGSQMTDISKTFSRVVQELGLNDGITDRRDRIVFHSLRHTFASWLAQKGVPLHSLAGLMGHKTTTMTQRYAHLSPDVQKAHAMLIDEPQGANVLQFKSGKLASTV